MSRSTPDVSLCAGDGHAAAAAANRFTAEGDPITGHGAHPDDDMHSAPEHGAPFVEDASTFSDHVSLTAECRCAITEGCSLIAV
jgi:hypothetical protein